MNRSVSPKNHVVRKMLNRRISGIIIASVVIGLLMTLVTTQYIEFTRQKISTIDPKTAESFGFGLILNNDATETTSYFRKGFPFMTVEYIDIHSPIPMTLGYSIGKSNLVTTSFLGAKNDPQGNETTYWLGSLVNFIIYGLMTFGLMVLADFAKIRGKYIIGTIVVLSCLSVLLPNQLSLTQQCYTECYGFPYSVQYRSSDNAKIQSSVTNGILNSGLIALVTILAFGGYKMAKKYRIETPSANTRH